MKRHAHFIFVTGLLFCLTACLQSSKPGGSSTTSTRQVSAFNSAEGKADAAAGVADSKLKEQAGKLRANVEAAKAEVDAMPQSNGQIVAAGELGLAQKRLEHVPSDLAEQEAARQRKILVESGKLEQAQKAYKEAEVSALKLAEELGAARAAAAAAIKERDEQKLKFLEQLEANRLANAKAIDELKNQVMHEQVRNLNYAAAVCCALAIGVFGVGFVFGGVASVGRVGPVALLFGIAGLLCFGLAQIVGQWWFKWACVVGILIVAAWIIVWAVKHYKQGDLKAQAEAKAANLHTTLQTVVPVLDDAYRNATGEVKDFFDKNILGKLSKMMDSDEKKAIHEVRASLQP